MKESEKPGARPAFPGALDYLPRPGNREIRDRPRPALPKIRMEERLHGGE